MNKRIVVAEDFGISRKIIASTLTKEGFQVVEAADGKEAISLFDGRQIDLLITDLNMPHMDGIELIKQVHAMEIYESLPVLLLTTEPPQDKLEGTWPKSITAVIKKPFDTNYFLGAVKNVLQIT